MVAGLSPLGYDIGANLQINQNMSQDKQNGVLRSIGTSCSSATSLEKRQDGESCLILVILYLYSDKSGTKIVHYFLNTPLIFML